MGKLHYGPDLQLELDDNSLVHFDAILQRLRGGTFQLHIVGLDGPSDGNLASLAITPGVPVWIEYYNGPEINIDMEAINYGIFEIQTQGLLVLPLRTAQSRSGIVDS